MSIFTSVIKCGICGEPLSGAGNPYTCAVCGNVSYTSNPMLEDELRTANAMRECTRFDEAMLVYKQIVKKYKSDDLSEVYWNLLLCEQRVMFETDEKGERFPSFYAIVSDDVEDSPYYTCALSAAEKHAPERVAIFTEMAEKMARAKQLYARIRESEKPYDVFICFKKSKLDGSGEETPDTDLAEDLYNQFAKDYRIFFSERTLRDVAVRDFEPNIYYALYTAKVLLLLCSKREYIDSKWVKNEWSRYHAMAQNPATGKTVIPVFLEDFEPGNLPAELLSYQGLADGRQLMGALESTLRKILKPLDMEAELNRRMQEMLAEQRRREEEQRQREAEQRQRMEEQQRQMQEQLEAMRKAQEQMEAMRKAQEQPKPTVPAPAIPIPTPQPAIPTPKPATPSPAAPKAAIAPAAKPTAAKPDFEIIDGVLKKYRGNDEHVVIPDTVTSIGEGVFKFTPGRKMFKSIAIPNSVTSIESKAFSYCNGITEITIPGSVKSIGNEAFQGCSRLVRVTIADGVTAIGKSAFSNCHKLKSVAIPDSVTSIGDSAFFYCDELESVTIPNSVAKIGNGAFYWCRKLTSVAIPDSVKSIGKDAFCDCQNLASVTLPTDLTDIGDGAFPKHTVIHRSSGATPVADSKEIKTAPKAAPATKFTSAPDFEIVDGVLKKYNGKGSDVTVPAEVTTIALDAFKNCSELTKVTVPSGVRNIHGAAFHECANLTEIVLPDTLKYLAYDAFLNCNKLRKTTVPVDGLYSIPCDSISGELRITGTGKIPLRRLEGASHISKVSIGKGVTAIGDAAFQFCHKLSSVTLPEGLVSIGGGAFWKCGLRSVRIPKSVTSIGKNAFYGNGLLESVVFECEDAELGADIFWECSWLREITCPASMEKKLKKQFGIFERKKINFIIK